MTSWHPTPSGRSLPTAKLQPPASARSAAPGRWHIFPYARLVVCVALVVGAVLLVAACSTGMGHAVRHVWAAYNRSLTRRPLFTKIMTGIVGTILGDAVAQYCSFIMGGGLAKRLAGKGSKPGRLGPEFRYDAVRLARLLVWSGTIATPLSHLWFDFLDRCILPGTPTSPAAVLIKLVLDQGLMAPFGTVLFFVVIKTLEGQPHLAGAEVRSKFRGVMVANWAVWPAANLINFAFVPPAQRILYVNVLAVAWSAFMSHVASKPPAAAHHPPGPERVVHPFHQGGAGIAMRILEPHTSHLVVARSHT